MLDEKEKMTKLTEEEIKQISTKSLEGYEICNADIQPLCQMALASLSRKELIKLIYDEDLIGFSKYPREFKERFKRELGR